MFTQSQKTSHHVHMSRQWMLKRFHTRGVVSSTYDITIRGNSRSNPIDDEVYEAPHFLEVASQPTYHELKELNSNTNVGPYASC